MMTCDLAVVDNRFEIRIFNRTELKMFTDCRNKGIGGLFHIVTQILRIRARISDKLLEVERGNLSADSFMNEIDDFVKGLVAKYSSVDNSVSFSENQPSIGNCPKCAKPIVKGKYGWYCSARCGMNLTKVFGVELSEGQIKSLLSGKETSYIRNGRKTVVVPNVIENEFNGKTYYNWATRKE